MFPAPDISKTILLRHYAIRSCLWAVLILAMLSVWVGPRGVRAIPCFWHFWSAVIYAEADRSCAPLPDVMEPGAGPELPLAEPTTILLTMTMPTRYLRPRLEEDDPHHAGFPLRIDRPPAASLSARKSVLS